MTFPKRVKPFAEQLLAGEELIAHDVPPRVIDWLEERGLIQWFDRVQRHGFRGLRSGWRYGVEATAKFKEVQALDAQWA